MLELILFYVFATVAVVSALLVITRHNVVHSAAFLGATLFAVAGIFLTLHAEFLAGVQSFILPAPVIPPAAGIPGNSEQVGTALYTMYLLPFEIASILLLVAIVGAVVLSKKRTPAE